MKNNKGFTLIELIAVIMLLALLTLIAIPSYNSIRNSINEKQYNNLVKLIETTASKYASVNGISLTNVKELIEQGLLETDDGVTIYDPRNKEDMACLLIEVNYKNGNYYSKLTDVKNCDIEAAKIENAKISILLKGTETGDTYENKYGTGDFAWIKENLELSAELGEISPSEVKSYRWVSLTGKTSEEKNMVLETSTIINTTVSLEVTTIENLKYYGYAKIQIDKENPIIKNVKVNSGDNWVAKRQVVVEATDQKGSGIGGYYVGEKACYKLNLNDYQEDNKFIFYTSDKEKPNQEYEYNVCVIDKVGNKDESGKKIQLSLNDTTPPKCIWEGEATDDADWKDTREVTLSCYDSDSGCESETQTFIFKDDGIKIKQKATIKDKAGNETDCTKDLKIQVDKTPPVLSISNPTNGEWVGKPWLENNVGKSWLEKYAENYKLTLTIEASDTTSGINEETITWSYTNTDWKPFPGTMEAETNHNYTFKDPSWVLGDGSRNDKACYKISDKAGNETYECTDIKVDVTSPTITINNPLNGGWANSNWVGNTIDLKITGNDFEGSGIDKNSWRWGYGRNDIPYSFPYDENEFADNIFTDSTWNAESDRNNQACYRVLDKAGNIAVECTDIKVDRTPPTCGVAVGSSYEWTSNDRTITQYCSDAYSGCSHPSYSKTYSTTTVMGGVTMSDNAGNVSYCEYPVYVNKDVPVVTVSGNIGSWVCGKCRTDSDTNYCATNDSGSCISPTGNTVGKVTYTKTNNTVTFSWEIRQGKATYIEHQYYVIFYIRNSSGIDIFSTYLRKNGVDPGWYGGSVHTGTVTYTFENKGTYYIYIDGNSANPSFDMNFGTITVS